MMYRTEFRKLTHFVPLWLYLGICFFFNVIITFNANGVDYYNEVSGITEIAGQKMNGSFVDTVMAMPDSSVRDNVLAIAEHAEPLYKTYDVDSDLTSYYVGLVRTSHTAVSMMEHKYDKVQERVEHLADIEADMDIYAGELTTAGHRNLFGILMRAITGESCMIAMLLTIYLFGYEKNAKTEGYFYGTRIGRKLELCKIYTSLIASVGCYGMIMLISLSIYFTHWNYAGIWNANVSSQMNRITDLLLTKPLLTWADFTVRDYLLATIGLGSVLVMVAVLFAGIVGTFVKNTYVAGLLTILIPGMGLFVTTVFANQKLWVAYLCSLFQPVEIWMAQDVWFSEGGSNAPCSWFEIKGLLLSLAVFTMGMILALRFSYKKDVA